MPVTIEVTRRGVYQNGKPIEVGKRLKLDNEPKGWVGKYRVVNSDEGKTMEVATPSVETRPDDAEPGEKVGGFEGEDKPKRRGRPKKVDEGSDEG